ncbi:MAG: hypothetical protein R3346_03320 [Candidatus Spechtbacterales bacterium]|nr:hypothetical protein [Candidatus Spechtbacterales bacterium]
MASAQRYKNNPILKPDESTSWEADSVFNASPIKANNKLHILYRAISNPKEIEGNQVKVSTIGKATSSRGFNFKNRTQFIKPEEDWEKFGCEDPRVTHFEGKYYIFYTALSNYPFSAEGIKVGVAVSPDMKKIEKKHLVTPFNAKAMALFPERVHGKIAVIFSYHTDRPPSKTMIVYLDDIEQLWSQDFWDDWEKSKDKHLLDLKRGTKDQIEVGAPPIKTKDGWVLVYSEIKNYQTPYPLFTIQTALLDHDNPTKVVGRTEEPLLIPFKDYEKYGKVENIVFPSGAIILKNNLHIFYSGADTVVAAASVPLKQLMDEMKKVQSHIVEFQRFAHNPILKPIAENNWEEKAVLNPAAIRLKNKTHILYRAMDNTGVSTIGYASSKDNLNIDERLNKPIYKPRKDFEVSKKPGNSGCEDPRLTKIGKKIYMLYTAYNGKQPPAGAITWIKEKDFLKKKWNWSEPKIITEPGVDNKDIVLFPRKINGRYYLLHRPHSRDVWIDSTDNLDFEKGEYLKGNKLFTPRDEGWDTLKVGANTPPIETPAGWVVIYHGVSSSSRKYRVGAVLLDKEDPTKVLCRLHDPLLEPEMEYEKKGQVDNVVFPCGHVIVDGIIYLYYGGADSVVAVAKVEFKKITTILAESIYEE